MWYYIKNLIGKAHSSPLLPYSLCTVAFKKSNKKKITHSTPNKKRKYMSNPMQDGSYSIRCALYNLKFKKSKDEQSRLWLESNTKQFLFV